MSNISDQTKQEQLIQNVHSGLHTMSNNENQSTSNGTSSHTSRSKPQACKVCGKMLSSASSYYVHMKLHSGTKPFRCTVSENGC